MKKTLLYFLLATTMVPVPAFANLVSIKTPQEMIRCLHDNVVNQIVFPGNFEWGNYTNYKSPYYSPEGKYFGATWKSFSSSKPPEFGAATLFTGPQNKPVYCEKDFCKATVIQDTDIEFIYTKYDSSGYKVGDSEEVLGRVIDGKLYCKVNPPPKYITSAGFVFQLVSSAPAMEPAYQDTNGLIWGAPANDNLGNPLVDNLPAAQAYCANIHAGSKHARLPTYREYLSLANSMSPANRGRSYSSLSQLSANQDGSITGYEFARPALPGLGYTGHSFFSSTGTIVPRKTYDGIDVVVTFTASGGHFTTNENFYHNSMPDEVRCVIDP